MITAVVFLLFVGTVPLLGGRLSLLGEIRLNGWWTIVASLVIQVVLIEVLSDSFDGVTAAVLHLFSYVLAFVFVWKNRHVVGMGIIVLGGVLNAAAIAANGGVMPARPEALDRAGIISDSPTFENSAPVEDARLAFLGDVFAIPEGVPFANVFSIGDVLLVLGAGATVHVVAESSLGRRLRRTRSQESATAGSTGLESYSADPQPPERHQSPGRADATGAVAVVPIAATPSVAIDPQRPSLAIRYAQSVEARRLGSTR